MAKIRNYSIINTSRTCFSHSERSLFRRLLNLKIISEVKTRNLSILRGLAMNNF